MKVPGGYYSAECNLKIFDLSSDEICTALETIDLKGYSSSYSQPCIVVLQARQSKSGL